MSDLKQMITLLTQSPSKEEKMQALIEAFEKFSCESLKIEEAYRALELKLALTQHYLEDILKNMSQGLLFVLSNGIIKTCNQAAEKILGVASNQMISHHFDQAIGLPLLKTAFADIQSGSSPLHAVINTQEPIEIEIELSPATHGIIVLLRDVTQLKQLERLANRNDRMKELGQMAAVMAHEIRNPLGGIKGFASLLYRDLVGQAELQNMAKQIIEGAEDINRLVVNILNYSRPLKAELQCTNISLFLREFVLHHPCKNQIVLKIHPFELFADVDPTLFRSIVNNLLDNALQASPKEGKVIIGLMKQNRDFVLKVEDSGLGISEKNLEKIFAPFFTTKPKGHGFGLAEVYRIVQEHQGSITVDSLEGCGSSFIVQIPMHSKLMRSNEN